MFSYHQWCQNSVILPQQVHFDGEWPMSCVVKRFYNINGWLIEHEGKILNAQFHWNRKKKQLISPWYWIESFFPSGDPLPTHCDELSISVMIFCMFLHRWLVQGVVGKCLLDFPSAVRPSNEFDACSILDQNVMAQPYWDPTLFWTWMSPVEVEGLSGSLQINKKQSESIWLQGRRSVST